MFLHIIIVIIDAVYFFPFWRLKLNPANHLPRAKSDLCCLPSSQERNNRNFDCVSWKLILWNMLSKKNGYSLADSVQLLNAAEKTSGAW